MSSGGQHDFEEEVRQYIGVRVPENTKRVNETAVRALARFVVNSEYKDKYFRSEPHLRSEISGTPERTAEFEMIQLRKELFGDCTSKTTVFELRNDTGTK